TAPGVVDVFWETSGHHDLDLVADVVAIGGRVLLSAAVEDVLPELPVRALYTKDVGISGFVISRAHVDDLATAARVVNRMLAAGELMPRVSEVLPLSATPDVHAQLESGQVVGRVLLRP
ncbi:MAG: zinc-binding dehydrogenase, partial [Nocardioidaceae bacterium]